MKVIIKVLLIASFLTSGFVNGQEAGLFDDQDLFAEEDLFEPQKVKKSSNLAIGFNAGLQKPFCDVLHTGVAPAGEVMFKLLVSDFFNLSFALGYGQLNDGFIKNTFVTNLISADLKANFNLITAGKFNPYITLGLGVFNFQYNITNANAIGSATLAGNRYFDGSFILGGGMEILLNPKFAINAFADYRHTTGDDLDGYSFNAKDGYLNTRLGFTYYLGSGKATKPEEELLALENLDFSEADTSGEEYDIFEDKLGEFETAETKTTMENYIRLKSRVDELNRLISQKENEINELRASLDFQNQRISDLEYRLASTSIASGEYKGDDFSRLYDEGLRNFYARDYHKAIQTFEKLRDTYPNHKLVSNCQYWIGESLFGLKSYADARDAFARVLDYANSYKKDDATLMLGRCYKSLGDKATARTYFQAVLDEYPDSEYVAKAKEWLSRI